MTGEIKSANFEAAEGRLYAESEFSDDKSSQHSLSVKGTSDGPVSRASTPRLPGYPEGPLEPVIHAIILPSYKEDIDTMRETLSVLASHVLAKPTYDVSENLCSVGLSTVASSYTNLWLLWSRCTLLWSNATPMPSRPPRN